ncbi:hypothetical protein A2U01_0007167 [Trifolium medium]|uniref:Uncharacterized protein n=1 Tax=Trifolium medium TaxID=97028 RepID=A0A392MFP8_9FABA|nr:hypothetical protein [Trifolium medium]
MYQIWKLHLRRVTKLPGQPEHHEPEAIEEGDPDDDLMHDMEAKKEMERMFS